MSILVTPRPDVLHGCWQTWSESNIDAVIRTQMDSGVIHTRRRFTGLSIYVDATAIYPIDLYEPFWLWWILDQRQGSIATYVVNPLKQESVYQWIETPIFNFVDPNAFQVSVKMYRGGHFPA